MLHGVVVGMCIVGLGGSKWDLPYLALLGQDVLSHRLDF